MPDHVEHFACLLTELTTSLCSLSLSDHNLQMRKQRLRKVKELRGLEHLTPKCKLFPPGESFVSKSLFLR